jgi:hypothetical protein
MSRRAAIKRQEVRESGFGDSTRLDFSHREQGATIPPAHTCDDPTDGKARQSPFRICAFAVPFHSRPCRPDDARGRSGETGALGPAIRPAAVEGFTASARHRRQAAPDRIKQANRGRAMALEEVTLAAFSFFNMLRLGSYIPQIACIARDRHGATSISFLTWGLWFLANGSTAAYALVNAGDVWIAAVNSVNSTCCLVVIVMTAVKRCRYRRGQRSTRPDAIAGQVQGV